jgi:hypothetical protein
MQGKDKTAEERRIAICIFDDVAEQCREAALKYLILHSSLSFFLKYLEQRLFVSSCSDVFWSFNILFFCPIFFYL